MGNLSLNSSNDLNLIAHSYKSAMFY